MSVYEGIKLEKGMYYESGRSFTQVLEKLDPSENYKGTALEGLDAYQRQLKRFDIRVKGAGSDMVEKFFRTTESAVLFPEYVARSVRAGMEEKDILPSITATVTKFDGLDYRSVYSDADEDDKTLRRVEEGTEIPQTEIKTQDHLVKLYKRGRMLVASYEAIRFQKLDLFSVMLRQIGGQITRMHLKDAVGVIKNGDGNQNAAEGLTIGTSPMTGTHGTLTYKALLEFWAQFDPYTMNTLLVPPAVMMKTRYSRAGSMAGTILAVSGTSARKGRPICVKKELTAGIRPIRIRPKSSSEPQSALPQVIATPPSSLLRFFPATR